MKKHELKKLEKLADSLELDIQHFDLDSYEYHEIKEQMLKSAHVPTINELDEEVLLWDTMGSQDRRLTWDSIAEFYDRRPFPEASKVKVELLNCLVLKFSQRHYGFAVQVLTKLFKGNLMHRTHRIIEANKHTQSKHRVLWFVGYKKTTNRILEELEKRNVFPRILRDSFLRRDFLHYHNGQIFNISRREFKEMQRRKAVTFKKEQILQLIEG